MTDAELEEFNLQKKNKHQDIHGKTLKPRETFTDKGFHLIDKIEDYNLEHSHVFQSLLQDPTREEPLNPLDSHNSFTL